VEPDLLLGIDVGTTNCKAVVFDPRGRQLGLGRVPTPCAYPQPNWAEFDAEALWQASAAAVRQALAAIDARRVRAVAVASMGESGVLVDADGQPLCPLIAWYDNRTLTQHRWWLEQVGAAPTFGISGLAPDPIFGVYKLMWLRDNAAEAYAAAQRWLHVADWIAFRLCGVQATDFSLATRTMLLDIRRRAWSDELIGRAGIRASLLPEPLASGTALGGVTRQAADVTGLYPGTLVATGGHDHVCGAFASGIIEAGSCLDSMGTAEAVFLPLDAPLLSDEAARSGLAYGVHVARGRFYALDGLWSGGGALEWALRLLAGPGEGAPDFERMQQAAAVVPPGSLGVYFLPRLTGGGQGAFAGLTGAAGQGALARAVFEGLAYEWRAYLEAMEQALGLRATSIGAIGGGTRSPLWMQIKADVLGRPIQVLEAEESVALGAALLAGLAAGAYASEQEATAASRRIGWVVEPDAARALFYEHRYREGYQPFAQALGALHARLPAAAEGSVG
jgi:xylulokinase